MDFVPDLDQREGYIVEDKVDDKVEHVAHQEENIGLFQSFVQALLVAHGDQLVALVVQNEKVYCREQHFAEERDAKSENNSDILDIEQLLELAHNVDG